MKRKTESIKIPPECCENCTNACNREEGGCTGFRKCKKYREWFDEAWNKIVRRFK